MTSADVQNRPCCVPHDIESHASDQKAFQSGLAGIGDDNQLEFFSGRNDFSDRIADRDERTFGLCIRVDSVRGFLEIESGDEAEVMRRVSVLDGRSSA